MGVSVVVPVSANMYLCVHVKDKQHTWTETDDMSICEHSLCIDLCRPDQPSLQDHQLAHRAGLGGPVPPPALPPQAGRGDHRAGHRGTERAGRAPLPVHDVNARAGPMETLPHASQRGGPPAGPPEDPSV